MWLRVCLRLGSRILLLVHDELVLVASGECATVVCDHMPRAIVFDVALDFCVRIVARRTVAP
ncbi:MAG: hypothetical protein JWQ77_2223 [Jatrophihabitans sp.]|nr:hypothetical protein [Jatrophihabitans sp.]